MRIGQFFADVLGAPLANLRWSWGAHHAERGHVYLRVWEDQIVDIDGVQQVLVARDRPGYRSPGTPERNAHLELLREGVPTFGVVCKAKNPSSPDNRSIRSFEDSYLLRLGEISRDGADTYARVLGTVPTSSVAGEPVGGTEPPAAIAVGGQTPGEAPVGEALGQDDLGQGSDSDAKAARRASFLKDFGDAFHAHESGPRLVDALQAEDPLSSVVRTHIEIERLLLAMLCVGHEPRQHHLDTHRIQWLDLLRLVRLQGSYESRCGKALERLNAIRNDMAHGREYAVTSDHEVKLWNGIPPDIRKRYRISLEAVTGSRVDLEAPLARFRLGLLITWMDVALALVRARKLARSNSIDQRLGAARLPDLLFGEDKLETANQAELKVIADWFGAARASGDVTSEPQSPPDQSNNEPAPTADPGRSPCAPGPPPRYNAPAPPVAR